MRNQAGRQDSTGQSDSCVDAAAEPQVTDRVNFRPYSGFVGETCAKRRRQAVTCCLPKPCHCCTPVCGMPRREARSPDSFASSCLHACDYGKSGASVALIVLGQFEFSSCFATLLSHSLSSQAPTSLSTSIAVTDHFLDSFWLVYLAWAAPTSVCAAAQHRTVLVPSWYSAMHTRSEGSPQLLDVNCTALDGLVLEYLAAAELVEVRGPCACICARRMLAGHSSTASACTSLQQRCPVTRTSCTNHHGCLMLSNIWCCRMSPHRAASASWQAGLLPLLHTSSCTRATCATLRPLCPGSARKCCRCAHASCIGQESAALFSNQ